MISPRDADPVTGTIFARPFEKAFSNGVSVCRELAANENILVLVKEGLSRSRDADPKVLNICQAGADEIRSIQDKSSERVFCIYDQPVTRDDPSLPPVPTHADLGRRPPPKKADRKKTQKDFAGKLRELFIAGEIPIAEFREGIPHRDLEIPQPRWRLRVSDAITNSVAELLNHLGAAGGLPRCCRSVHADRRRRIAETAPAWPTAEPLAVSGRCAASWASPAGIQRARRALIDCPRIRDGPPPIYPAASRFSRS